MLGTLAIAEQLGMKGRRIVEHMRLRNGLIDDTSPPHNRRRAKCSEPALDALAAAVAVSPAAGATTRPTVSIFKVTPIRGFRAPGAIVRGTDWLHNRLSCDEPPIRPAAALLLA